MGEPVLLEVVRAPFARNGGAFREEHPDTLVAHPSRGPGDGRAGLDPEKIEKS
jgi:hypothetical protein